MGRVTDGHVVRVALMPGMQEQDGLAGNADPAKWLQAAPRDDGAP